MSVASAGCCTYWCTPAGPQPGTYDPTTKIVTPPAGATGGPYTSKEEANEKCPFEVVCYEVCETTQKLARVVVLTFADKADGATCLPNSIPLTYGPLDMPAGCVGGYAAFGWNIATVPVPGYDDPQLYAGKLCNNYGGIAVIPVINAAGCIMYINCCPFNNSQTWVNFPFTWNFCVDEPIPGVQGPLPGQLINGSGGVVGTFNAYLDFGRMNRHPHECEPGEWCGLCEYNVKHGGQANHPSNLTIPTALATSPPPISGTAGGCCTYWCVEQVVTCDVCPFTVTPTVVISFENATGVIPVGTMVRPLDDPDVIHDDNPCGVVGMALYYVNLNCTDVGQGPQPVFLQLLFSSSSGPDYGTSEVWDLNGRGCTTTPVPAYRWVHAPAGYSITTVGTDSGSTLKKDVLYPCGTAEFFTARRYIGRVQVYQGFGGTGAVLGEADVYVEPAGVGPTLGTYDPATKVITPPAGAAGGPYTSLEEATAGCGRLKCEGWTMQCEDAPVPLGFEVTFTDKTGACTDPAFPTTLFIPLDSTAATTSFWTTPFFKWTPADTGESAVGVQWANNPGLGTDFWRCTYSLQFNGSGYLMAIENASLPPGWVQTAPVGGYAPWAYKHSCPIEYPDGVGPFVVRLTDSTTNTVIGTAKVYLTKP